mmetsp:Transcript_4809/g.12932  ORF Transcript_4809/g.12932 Transcript_4809/m.12932 type:complete len:226 (-) Transcript_4809:554-1231(-)
MAPSAAESSSSRLAALLFQTEACSSACARCSCAACTCSCIPSFLAFMASSSSISAIFCPSWSTTRLVSRATSPWIMARCCKSLSLSDSSAAICSLSCTVSSAMPAMRSSRARCSASAAPTRCASSSALSLAASSCSATARASFSAANILSVRLFTSRWMSGCCWTSLAFSASAASALASSSPTSFAAALCSTDAAPRSSRRSASRALTLACSSTCAISISSQASP